METESVSGLLLLLNANDTGSITFGLLGICLLLISSALVSSSEVAFFSLKNDQLNEMLEEGSTINRAVVALRANPKELLATILIANNFINIGIVLLSEYTLRLLFSDSVFLIISTWLYEQIGITYYSLKFLTKMVSFLVTVVSVTFMLVLFGEVVPKVYANTNNVRVAKAMARPLNFCKRLFWPLIQMLVNSTSFIEKKLSGKSIGSASRQDIDEAIELTVLNEKHSKRDIDILKSIIKFGDVLAKQIMCSRVDMVALNWEAEDLDVVKAIKESGFSRIPVYDEDIDKITGILFVKDLISQIYADEPLHWREKVRSEVLYVPESKKIQDLLHDFQEKRMHMAIVVNEYGDTVGLVTLEDILEEVIGEIRDEFDDMNEIEYRQIDENNFIFEGKSLLNDVCRVLEISNDSFDEVKGESDTIAGLILEIIGFIPKKGAEVGYKGFKFQVASVNKRRIENIKITIPK